MVIIFIFHKSNIMYIFFLLYLVLPLYIKIKGGNNMKHLFVFMMSILDNSDDIIVFLALLVALKAI